jgi:hypothetical protein
LYRSSGGVWSPTEHEVEALIAIWLLRPRQISAGSTIKALHAGFVDIATVMTTTTTTEAKKSNTTSSTSATTGGTHGGTAISTGSMLATTVSDEVQGISGSSITMKISLLELFQRAVARTALLKLRDDDEDLYYEGGVDMHIFIENLVRFVMNESVEVCEWHGGVEVRGGQDIYI